MATYKYRFLGTGTTNAQGIATLTTDPNNETINGYTGVGAGKIDIIASDTSDPTTSGAIVSEVKQILDCISYDKGKSGTGNHNDSIWSNSTNFTRGDEYTTMASTGTAYSTSVPIQDNVCIELDFKTIVEATSSHVFNIRNSVSTNLVTLTKARLGLTDGAWQHYKITISEGTVSWINETTGTSNSVTDITGMVKFTVRVPPSNDAYFKELKIYPI